jgi:hypothetical protein
MKTARILCPLYSVVAILAVLFYLTGVAMAQSPKERSPADKPPVPELDSFGNDGTPTFEDTPTPTFQPQPPRQGNQDKGIEGKDKKDKKGNDVVTIQSSLPDLKYGGMTITPVGGSAGDSGIPGQPATLTITIVNGGTADAGEFRLDTWIHLPSPPNFGSVGDFSQTFPSLAAGASVTTSYSFTFPGSYGTYFPRSTVDSGSTVTEANEVNNRNTGSYTLIEMATVVPPSTFTTGGTPVIMRGVAKPYGKKWPVGCPTATFTPAGAGAISDVVTNMQGDASITFTPAAGFAGIVTITFECGTSSSSGTINVLGIRGTFTAQGTTTSSVIASPAQAELMDTVAWFVPNLPNGATVQRQIRRAGSATWINSTTISTWTHVQRVAGNLQIQAVVLYKVESFEHLICSHWKHNFLVLLAS